MISNKILTEKDNIRFYLELDKALREKDVELSFYYFLRKYFEKKYENIKNYHIFLSSPYNTDGLVTIEDTDFEKHLLIEAKYNKNFNSKRILCEVLTQAIQYSNVLKSYQKFPSVIILVSKETIAVIDSHEIESWLSINFLYGESPSNLCENSMLIEDLIKTINNYKVFDLNKNLKINLNEIFEEIDTINSKSSYRNERKDKNLKMPEKENYKFQIEAIDNEYFANFAVTALQWENYTIAYDDGKGFIYQSSKKNWRPYDENKIIKIIKNELFKRKRTLTKEFFNDNKPEIIEPIMELVKEKMRIF